MVAKFSWTKEGELCLFLFKRRGRKKYIKCLMTAQFTQEENIAQSFKDRVACVKKPWRYTQSRRRICATIYITVVLLIGIYCLFLDWSLYKGKEICLLTSFVNRLGHKELVEIRDLFDTVWGTAITITIFMLEISNQYRYGISLKTIVYRSLNKVLILIGAGGYLLLCPIMYLSINNDMRCTAVWCVCTAILSFGVALYFSVRIFRKQSVRQLLRDLTYKRIEAESKTIKKEFQNIHSMIDGFPITDFIIHIDYTNAEETRCLTDILSEVLYDAGLGIKKIKKNVINMTLLMTWASHIIYNSGVSTEEEKSRTIRILYELWGKLKSGDQDILLVQLTIPFIEMGNDTGREMLERIFNATGVSVKRVVLYLLLYTEYKFWYVDNRIAGWFRYGRSNIKRSIFEILRGNVKWDEESAWELWKAWRVYNSYEGQMGLEQFFTFCNDIEMLQKRRKYAVRSTVLIELVEEEI